MGTTIIGAGETLAGTTITDGVVQVASGGSAIGITLDGGYLQVEAGGVANGTMIGGGTLQVFSGGSAENTLITSGGFQQVMSGGMAADTLVENNGFDEVMGGSDVGATIYDGGSLVVSDGGVATSPVFTSGSFSNLAGGTISGAVLNSMTELLVPAGSIATDATLSPGASIDLATAAYAAGGSTSLDSATDVLTINEGGVVTSVQLAGSYTGHSFSLGGDGAIATDGAGTPGTVVSLNAAGIGSSGGGFDSSTGTTINNLIADAQAVATLAHEDITDVEPIAGSATGVFSATLDSDGNQAIYSTIDTVGHVISESGNNQSVIAAGSGADTVTVSGGNDLIATGTGSNSVYLVTGDNTLYSEGTDNVYVGAGLDTVTLSGDMVLTGDLAQLSVFLTPNAQLTLHTGVGSVDVQGGFGSGAFSGGTNGNNVLIAGTGPTTLYAGGAGDLLIASGGSTTTMDGWSGNERMLGQYSQGTDIFNFNNANVLAVGGAGQNTFNVGSGNNIITSGQGTSIFDFVNGSGGGNTYIADFNLNSDHIHLSGYAANAVVSALNGATTYQNSEILHLSDNTTISIGHVTGLTQASFV